MRSKRNWELGICNWGIAGPARFSNTHLPAVPDAVSAAAPPTFLLVSNNDACCSEPLIKLLQLHRKAKVPVEAHIYTEGDHGFNMGKRSTFNSLKTWPDRLTDWLKDTGLIRAK